MYSIESERDRVNADAREAEKAYARKAQAARVSAWWGKSAEKPGAFVRNASETPVYQVFLTAVKADDHSDGSKIYSLVVPPSDQPLFFPVSDGTPSGQESDRRVKLGFTDAAGVRWLRNQYGLLEKLRPELCIVTDPVRARVLAQFEDEFQATYGVRATFQEFPADLPQERFASELQGQTEVDALVCPHDWIGDLTARDVIEPTVLSANHQHAFPDWALSALTSGGRLYGLPTTTSTVALIRNARLVPEPPATFDELLATGRRLRDAGQVSEVFALRVDGRGNPFHVWPLFTSAGGWLFGRTPAGGWDPAQIGLAAPESIAAFERLRSLGQAGLGILRPSVGRLEALRLFTTGRTAYLISTPDALGPSRAAGIPLLVSEVPPFADGLPASAFTLVHGLVMAKHGTNKVIAHDLFADYLSHAHVMTALSEEITEPVALRATTNRDPAVQQFLALCGMGVPMPSFPEMNATWRILEEAELAIIEGAPAEPVAQRAAAKLNAVFAAEEARPHGRSVVA